MNEPEIGGPVPPHAAPPHAAPPPPARARGRRVAALLQRPSAWSRAWWLWFTVLFALSSIPGHHLGPVPFAWFDKLEHAAYFFLGGLLLGGGLAAAGQWPGRWWLLPLVAALAGLFDEFHQIFTPGRSGLDPGDWMADILGGTLAVWPVRLISDRLIGGRGTALAPDRSPRARPPLTAEETPGHPPSPP